MLLILVFSLLFVQSLGRPQNQLFYTPYDPQQQQSPNSRSLYGGQAPCGRDLIVPAMMPEQEPELEPDPEQPTGIDAQQPAQSPEPAVGEAPCDKPGSEKMALEEMCSLPPNKGNGDDDIFRYYYNPVVQQCIPFSYSGKGGNANRFVSVKNCYEICHPADPTVKKPRVVSGIKAYLVPNLKSDCEKSAQNQAFGSHKTRQQPKEVVIRQIPHPLDPTKTLTIIQNAQYVKSAQLSQMGLSNMSPGDSNDPNIDPNVRRLYQYESVPQYIPPFN